MTPSPFLADFDDYRDFLDARLRAKKGKNPRFSLRAYAKQLGLQISTLSGLVAKRSSLSVSVGLALCEKLDLSALERSYFRLLLERSHLPKGRRDALLDQEISEISWLLKAKRMEDEAIGPLRLEWRHFAVLEWMDRRTGWDLEELPDFAGKIGLAPELARKTVQELVAADFAEELSDRPGTVRRKRRRLAISSTGSSFDFRAIHREGLQRALAALSEQEAEIRFSATEFLLLDEKGFASLREEANASLDRLHYCSQDRNREKSFLYSVSFHAYRLAEP